MRTPEARFASTVTGGACAVPELDPGRITVRPGWSLADVRDVGPDEASALLIEFALASITVAVREGRECACGCDRVGLVVRVSVEGDVQERVVGQSQDQVGDVVRAGLGELSEQRLDPALILVSCLW